MFFGKEKGGMKKEITIKTKAAAFVRNALSIFTIIPPNDDNENEIIR